MITSMVSNRRLHSIIATQGRKCSLRGLVGLLLVLGILIKSVAVAGIQITWLTSTCSPCNPPLPPRGDVKFKKPGTYERLRTHISEGKVSELVLFQCESRQPTPCGKEINPKSSADLIHATSLLNLRYARQHGYDYLRFISNFPDRFSAWCKVWSAKILLEHYAYLLYLDSDAVVHTHRSLEHALQYKQQLGSAMMMADSPAKGLFPNNGVWLVRSSHPKARDFFSRVWAYPKEFPDKRYNTRVSLNDTLFSWPWELASFSAVFGEEAGHFNKLVHLLPRFTLDHPRGRVVRHLWSVGTPGSTDRTRPLEYLSYIQQRLRELSASEMYVLTCGIEKLSLVTPEQ
mmetsp:Transcript_34826/g.76138  ORF Transcript_34826/g.76138 Transcript_34826/m.76138 type:complete len:344 (-) Transcript_34826:417-1448(-)